MVPYGQRVAGRGGKDSINGAAVDSALMGSGGVDSLDGGFDFDVPNGKGGFDTCLNGEKLINCECTS